MKRSNLLRTRVLVILGVVAALGCAAVVSTVVSADSSNTQAASGQARGLSTWFSVTRTGESVSADALKAMPAEALPSIESARQTVAGAAGERVIVSADDSRACVLLVSGGGGCWASEDPSGVAQAPVLVTGPGQDETADQTQFVALVGDGIDAINVTDEDGKTVSIPVTNNVAIATVPGRVLSWQWRDPSSGASRTHSVS